MYSTIFIYSVPFLVAEGTFQLHPTDVHDGVVSPVRTQYSIRNSTPATWLHVPSNLKLINIFERNEFQECRFKFFLVNCGENCKNLLFHIVHYD